MTDKNPSVLRTFAWVALAVCATANAVLSIRGSSLPAHLVTGALTVLCLVVLVLAYRRRRP